MARPSWDTVLTLQNLVLDYAFHVDRYEAEAVAALFTEGCVVDYGPGMGETTHGRAALLRRLNSGLGRFAATSHHVSNTRIEMHGDSRAAGVSYLSAWHRYPDWPRTEDAIVWGQYHDVFERTDRGWLIAERRLRVAGAQAFDVAWEPIGRRVAPLTDEQVSRILALTADPDAADPLPQF